jgi:hypothetical protein
MEMGTEMEMLEAAWRGQRIEYGQVQVLDNVLPLELYRELVLSTQRIGWQFGWNTPSNPNTRYWHHEVGQGRKSNKHDISGNVRKHPLKVFSLYQNWLLTHLVPATSPVLRYYLNAHTYGTDGWPHTDVDQGEELTCVLYLNTEWRPEWCGETVVFDGQGDIAEAVLPKANRLLTFPSDRLHAPRPLSKSFEGLRVVLVVKLGAPNGRGAEFTRLEDVTQEEKMHLAFLEEVGSHQLPHSGRNLLTHLWGVYRTLKQWGAARDVCLAGLYHSIFGTSVIKIGLPVSREAVRSRIGTRAERLAWLFGALQRPQCWCVKGGLLPMASGGFLAVDVQDQQDLRLIEKANLDEQGILQPERRLDLP